MAHGLLAQLSDKQIGDKLNQEGGGQRELADYYGIPRPSVPSAEADSVHTLGYLYSPNWTVLSTAGDGYVDLTFQVVKGQTSDSLTRAAAARVFDFSFVVLDADRYDVTAAKDIFYTLAIQTTGTTLDATKAAGRTVGRAGFPVLRASTDANGIAKVRITRTDVAGNVVHSTAGAASCLVMCSLDIAHAVVGYANRMLLTNFDA